MLYASLKNLDKAVSSEDHAKVLEFKWVKSKLSIKGPKLSISSKYREKQEKLNFDDEELNQYFISTEKLDDPIDKGNVPTVAESLAECVVHHQMLLDFVNQFEDLFTWFVLPKITYAGE